jgi:hypothetical protein
MTVTVQPTEPAVDAATPPRRVAAATRRAVRGWWAVTRRPMSIAAAWRLSWQVVPARIPGQSETLAAVWFWSNVLDRTLLLVLQMIAPAFLSGVILWCAVKPTRRYGLYLVVLALILVPILVGG